MGGRSALEAYVAQSIPMGRWGTSEEVANATVFLCSPMARYMTGATINVSGGFLMY